MIFGVLYTTKASTIIINVVLLALVIISWTYTIIAGVAIARRQLGAYDSYPEQQT